MALYSSFALFPQNNILYYFDYRISKPFLIIKCKTKPGLTTLVLGLLQQEDSLIPLNRMEKRQSHVKC